jgi:hypothetical protein
VEGRTARSRDHPGADLCRQPRFAQFPAKATARRSPSLLIKSCDLLDRHPCRPPTPNSVSKHLVAKARTIFLKHARLSETRPSTYSRPPWTAVSGLSASAVSQIPLRRDGARRRQQPSISAGRSPQACRLGTPLLVFAASSPCKGIAGKTCSRLRPALDPRARRAPLTRSSPGECGRDQTRQPSRAKRRNPRLSRP